MVCRPRLTRPKKAVVVDALLTAAGDLARRLLAVVGILHRTTPMSADRRKEWEETAENLKVSLRDTAALTNLPPTRFLEIQAERATPPDVLTDALALVTCTIRADEIAARSAAKEVRAES